MPLGAIPYVTLGFSPISTGLWKRYCIVTWISFHLRFIKHTKTGFPSSVYPTVCRCRQILWLRGLKRLVFVSFYDDLQRTPEVLLCSLYRARVRTVFTSPASGRVSTRIRRQIQASLAGRKQLLRRDASTTSKAFLKNDYHCLLSDLLTVLRPELHGSSLVSTPFFGGSSR